MSAFKRYQSKVFWDHMALQDLGEEEYQPRGISQYPREDIEEVSEEDNSQSFECDATDGGNITAIRVCKSNVGIDEDVFAETSTSNDNGRRQRKSANNTADQEVSVHENRSFSPVSQGHRSLDSGFSDSERSNCSEISSNGTPRRRRHRKSKRQLRGAGGRSNATWLENEELPNPTFTSTPKSVHCRVASHHKFSECQARRHLREEPNGEEAAGGASTSLEDEHLGDFLYASEPPEDVEDVSSRSFLFRNPVVAQPPVVDRSRDEPRTSSRLAAPVRAWLNDLMLDTETECGATLQSKALPRRKTQEPLSEESQTRDLRMLTSASTAAATRLLVTAEKFERHYRYVVDKITRQENGRSQKEMIRAIEDDSFTILTELGAPPPRRIQQGSYRAIMKQLEVLKRNVDGAIDTRLDFYIERVVRGLEEAPREGGSAARGALAALTALGLAGSRAGSSIARCSGVRALLTSLISAGRLSSELRAASLRALASVCCCPSAIERFVRDGGPEILVDLLSATSSPDTEKMEATALVVQITAPWTKAMGLPHLEAFRDALIGSLTDLAERTSCSQTLLLTAAAFHHLSKSKKFAFSMLERNTVSRLLKCVRKSAGGNVWVMEQVASLVGELARIPEARPHLAKAKASVALVCFLRMRPPGLEEAYQRLEVTAAAALTRLCVDPEIARQVVAVGGADCLPTYSSDDLLTDDEEQIDGGLLKYTKSLRVACKRAAKEIGVAKASDYSGF